MQITDIQKNKKRLRDIFVDGEYFASIDIYILGLSGLKEGDNIEQEKLISLVNQSNDYRAYNKAIYLLGFRDYTCKELRNKLKLEFPEECIEKAIEKLKNLNFLNDNRLAAKYLKVLLFEKHFSKKRAEIELIKKGIDIDVATQVTENVDVNEREQIEFLISRKYKNAYEDENEKRRAIAFLQRRGYSFSDIASVLFNRGE